MQQLTKDGQFMSFSFKPRPELFMKRVINHAASSGTSTAANMRGIATLKKVEERSNPPSTISAVFIPKYAATAPNGTNSTARMVSLLDLSPDSSSLSDLTYTSVNDSARA